MMRLVPVSSAVFCALFMTAQAQAATILPPFSNWEYTFTDPTGSATWNTTTGVGGIWSLGQAPFGNQTAGDPDFIENTFWPADGGDGNDLWVRNAVDLTGWSLNSIRWDLGVDNGFTLYINGTFVAAANAEGYTSRWEYPNGTFGVNNSLLLPGLNVVAVALEDHGGATAFDMQITGNPVATAVPEPATLTLFGIGLTGLARRKLRCRSAV
jgi:hypothetical protein